MKRHPDLREFSDEHHQGLVQALRLKRAASGDGENAEETAKAFLEFWQKEDSIHLRKEEEVLLPVLVRNGVDIGQETVVRMLTQHARLRDLAMEVSRQVVREEIDSGTLRDLGGTLEAHIRLEERELFPLIEEVLPEDALAEVSARLKLFEVEASFGPLAEPPATDEDPPYDSWPDVGNVQVEKPEAALVELPGSGGEHELQERYGTKKRAYAFYKKQMLDHLNPLMREFIVEQELLFIGTADSHGECDCSFRSGLPGFVRVLDEKTLIYPEIRGNGIMASLGNISENQHIGMMFIDFFESTVGLHVNGEAQIIDNEELLERTDLPEELRWELEVEGGRKPERWVMVEVEEAYIQCAKHIPLLKKLDKDVHWGTDNETRKGGDYFKAKRTPRPWSVDSPA